MIFICMYKGDPNLYCGSKYYVNIKIVGVGGTNYYKMQQVKLLDPQARHGAHAVSFREHQYHEYHSISHKTHKNITLKAKVD